MFKIIMNYAFRNIFRTPLRSFFTLFSVSLIIMLYTVLTSVGNSFTQQVSTVLEQEDTDIAIQSKYATSLVSSMIDNATVESIMQIDGIHSHHALVLGSKRLYGKSSVPIFGVSDFNVFAQRLGFNIIEGHSLNNKPQEIVIGEKIAQVYGLNIGDEIKLKSDKKYLIVGIYSSWLNFINSGVVITLRDAQQLVNKPNKINLLFLTLTDTTKTAEVVHRINKLFPEMRAIESQQLPNYLGPIKTIFYFSNIVSIMTLIIAIAVLLNTFIMAISERTKEVGILSAMGWPRQMIISIFLVEALVLSFTGGMLGYFASYPVFEILDKNFTNISIYLPEAPSIDIFFNVLLMSFFIGLFSALFPALYGTKINTAKAIRHE